MHAHYCCQSGKLALMQIHEGPPATAHLGVELRTAAWLKLVLWVSFWLSYIFSQILGFMISNFGLESQRTGAMEETGRSHTETALLEGWLWSWASWAAEQGNQNPLTSNKRQNWC